MGRKDPARMQLPRRRIVGLVLPEGTTRGINPDHATAERIFVMK
jgi:hypothetical protein